MYISNLNISATSIMEAAIKAAEEMPNKPMNNEQIVAFAIDNADKIVQPLIPQNATEQQQQHMVNLQTNALIYSITAKQIDDDTYRADDKLSENVSACIWKNIEFGSGDKVVTFVGEVRVSPEDVNRHGSNDGVSQLYKIFMSCEVYAKQKRVRVRLANVFFSFGVDRRFADESTAIGETILCMTNHIKRQLKDVKEDEVYVVAADSIRIHLEADMVQQYEEILHAIYPNAKLRFIETWGLVDLEKGKETNFAVARAVKDREGCLERLGEHSTKNNPDKSIVVSKKDQQTQNDIRKREIHNLYDDNKSDCELKTHIRKTEELGEVLMDYLSNKKVNIIIEEKKKKTVTLLVLFRDKWNSLAMEKDSEEAAKEFQKFYLDNKEHMQDFLQRHDLPEIFDVNYVRTSKVEKYQSPGPQIGINFAAAEKDNNKKRPDITIYDSGKDRKETGKPGFVATMILICTGRVGRTIMLNPVRASAEPTEVLNMLGLFELCSQSEDSKQLFSECVGKVTKDLVMAEHYRILMTAKFHEKYQNTIKSLEEKLVSKIDIDKILYKEMRLIYNTRTHFHLD